MQKDFILGVLIIIKKFKLKIILFLIFNLSAVAADGTMNCKVSAATTAVYIDQEQSS